MKVKEGFVKQRIGEKTVLVSTGDLSHTFRGMIELNYTAADIWDWVAQGHGQEQVARLLAEKYGIGLEKAMADAGKIIEKMRESGVMEDA